MPFEGFSVNLKEVLIEISLLIIHISYVIISIFENNMEIRIYFDSFAFFAMLFCITIEIFFSLLNTIIEIISTIISFCHNLCNKKHKKFKLFLYKRVYLQLKMSTTDKQKSSTQGISPQRNPNSRQRRIANRMNRNINKKEEKRKSKGNPNVTIINVKPCNDISNSEDKNLKNIINSIQPNKSTEIEKKEKGLLENSKHEGTNSFKDYSNGNISTFQARIIHQDLSQIKQLNSNSDSVVFENLKNKNVIFDIKKADLNPIPLNINVERNLDFEKFQIQNKRLDQTTNFNNQKKERFEEEKIIKYKPTQKNDFQNDSNYSPFNATKK